MEPTCVGLARSCVSRLTDCLSQHNPMSSQPNWCPQRAPCCRAGTPATAFSIPAGKDSGVAPQAAGTYRGRRGPAIHRTGGEAGPWCGLGWNLCDWPHLVMTILTQLSKFILPTRTPQPTASHQLVLIACSQQWQSWLSSALHVVLSQSDSQSVG